jgi:hypothetical protein
MKKSLPTNVCLVFFVFLASCVETPTSNRKNSNETCNSGIIRLTADFEASRIDDCKVLGEKSFLITLKPENKPINHSPWYAFKVEADQATDISVAIEISGGLKNRYLPKFSHDMKTWHLHSYQDKGERLELKIKASSQAVYIAGQEIINNQYYVDWANGLQDLSYVSYTQLATSQQGRPISKIESRGASNEWLVILGRLHPPEITGALALFPFVETLLANNEVAANFRKNYNILIIPNVNPDGVAMGNWRHNANGIDLNRDWISLRQPETKQIHEYLQQIVANGGKIKFAVDFHSTRREVFIPYQLTMALKIPISYNTG